MRDAGPVTDRLRWLAQPRRWGIAARSAAFSAAVVLSALSAAALLLIPAMLFSLLAAVDDATAARVGEIVTTLKSDPSEEFDDALLATNDHVVVVQIVDGSGAVIAQSAGAPDAPLLPVTQFGPALRRGLPDDLSPNDDMRLSGQTVDTAGGQYTVLVGGGSEAAESAVKSVALLLAVAAPAVVAVAGVASYHLVRRSLRSVDAIRYRVAEISTSDLAERVPVPVQDDEISALAETMNDMLARLEAAHRAQRQFVGDASHELRSPLTTIISALEVADAHPELLNIELANSILLPEAHRMRGLVEDLLLLARADERGLPVRRDPVFLDDICDAQAQRLRCETTLKIATDVSPGQVLGDEAAITRAVRNLVDNAVQHAVSRIEIAVHHDHNTVVVTVGDDGPGIPVAEREHVFDRFVRLDTARSRIGGGTGLGLAIASEIAASHDGTINIGDRPGGGTMMSLALPSPTVASPWGGPPPDRVGIRVVSGSSCGVQR